MKRLLIGLVVFVFTVPSVARADPAADFKARCSPCHQGSLNMQKKAKFLKVDPKKLDLGTSRLSRDEMITITEKGRGQQMPAFDKKLTGKQIEDIVDYIMALNKGK